MVSIWSFIPHLREVEELDEDIEEVKIEKIQQLEFRDESNRPWWKYFDEYEYRLNKYERQRHKWWYWFEEGTSAAEKKLLIKLDFLVVFYCMIIFWLKSLDQSNFEKAYVSGMKEDVGFTGNDYVNTQTVFSVGLVVFQFPFMYIFPRVSIHYLIPVLDVIWGAFTLGLYRVETVGQVQALRFLVSIFEAGFYPGAHWLFGSWYRSFEAPRRSQIWYFGNMLGSISSGLFQASIYNNYDGNSGLEGWRWMFIVDGIITIVIGLGAFWILPGTPDKCYSLFLTDDEIRLARRRLRKDTVEVFQEKPSFFSWKLWKRILLDWKLWGLTLFDTSGWNSSNTPGSGLVFWLKSLGRYSTGKINNLSATSAGVGFILVLVFGLFADGARSRYGAIVLSQLLNLIGNIILAKWYVPESAKWFAFMLQYAGWATASVRYSWINDILRHDVQDRAIIFIVQFAVAQSTTIWINRIIWPTVEAPRYPKGYVTIGCFAFTMIIAAFVLLWKYNVEERKNAYGNGIVLYNSSKGDNLEEIKKQYEQIQNKDSAANYIVLDNSGDKEGDDDRANVDTSSSSLNVDSVENNLVEAKP